MSLLKELIDIMVNPVKEKLSGSFLFPYLCTFLIYNWELYFIFFMMPAKLEGKRNALDVFFDQGGFEMYLHPLAITLFYMFVWPQLSKDIIHEAKKIKAESEDHLKNVNASGSELRRKLESLRIENEVLKKTLASETTDKNKICGLSIELIEYSTNHMWNLEHEINLRRKTRIDQEDKSRLILKVLQTTYHLEKYTDKKSTILAIRKNLERIITSSYLYDILGMKYFGKGYKLEPENKQIKDTTDNRERLQLLEQHYGKLSKKIKPVPDFT